MILLYYHILEEFNMNQKKSLKLKENLTALMDNIEDRVFIFQLHSDTEPQLFGKAKLQSTQPFLLV